jgi:hypothetical protein
MAIVNTVHGEKFEIVPGRSVIEYRNGFPNDARAFATAYDRDQYVRRQRELARRMTATSLCYELA